MRRFFRAAARRCRAQERAETDGSRAPFAALRFVALRIAPLLIAALIMSTAPATDATAQTGAGEDERSEQELSAEAAERQAVADSLAAIESILGAQAAKREEREALAQQLEAADNDVDTAQLTEAITAVDAEIQQLDAQIEGLATGVSSDDVSPETREFDLNSELQDLVEPFLLMVKSATENARAIARLERALNDAERRIATAEKALTTLGPMLDAVEAEAESAAAGEESEAAQRLNALLESWTDRRAAAEDEAATARRQLNIRRDQQLDPGRSAGEAFSSFVQERGRNLVFGVSAFAAVFFLLRLARNAALALLGPTRSRTVPARLGALIFDALTVMAAVGTMITVFNYFHDWLLTGLSILLAVALGWIALRSLPTMVEQITLLLNLGAVQEGERVMFNGAPWLVKRLDFYTDLVNPALRGGSFTLPARELTGLHSRPMAEGEVWFPTQEGDWVILSDEVFGEVVFQSPEMVQVREEGGAIVTYSLEGFLEQSPRNLSHGFQRSVRFGVDYRHEDIALTAIPATFKKHLRTRLGDLVGAAAIREIDAKLVEAGPSALEFELEARLTGAAAALYEDVGETLTRAAVECCLREKWTIPTPQLTIHRA